MTDHGPYDQDDPVATPRRTGVVEDPGPWDDEELVEADEPWDDDDYVHVAPHRGTWRKVLLALLVLLVLLAVVAAAGWLWLQRRIDPPGPPGAAVSIEIPEGSTTEQIGSLLEEEGVIASDTVWAWYVRWKSAGPFQAGLYEFRENSHLDDVIAVLDAGPAPPQSTRFTIPEGLTVQQTIERLADEKDGLGLDAARLNELLTSGQVRSKYLPPDAPTPEGTLFPETYEVGDDFDERSVLQTMVGQLDATMAELQVESAQERFNLTPYEILIVASMIERETRIDEERPMIARVIYNRLSQGIALGIDATSCYEKGEQPCVLTTSDLESDSPYNTRINPGLTPTPIASPGRASIEAALNPADGPWIYYVLQDAEGRHFFTDSADEFAEAKARCEAAGLGCG